VVVGICRLSLYFPESGSLKTKRQGLRKILDRVRAKFNVAIAEVSDQDTWQRSAVGFVVVGNEGPHVQSMIDHIVSFVDEIYVAQILDRQVEVLTYNDEEAIGSQSGGSLR
jgi:uncharacterized protein